jgi:hypothetical protein
MDIQSYLGGCFCYSIVPVTKYPGEGGAILDNTAAVYVEKINPIYIFGGLTITNGVSSYLDKIWSRSSPYFLYLTART